MKLQIILLILVLLKFDIHAQSLISNDSIIKNIKSQFKITSYDQIDNIDWFNRDTVLVSGYISDNLSDAKYSEVQNVIYQSFNGGINWNRIYFNGDAWIYDTYFFENGKIWMGGSDEAIYFSNDYGTTWTKKERPFKPSDRVYDIYMVDSLKGIVGGLSNGLAITNNNWVSTIQIPTPLDQGRYTITKSSARKQVIRVGMIDSLILINQNRHIYYSKLNLIDWKPFCIPVVDFVIDELNQEILLISLDGKSFVLDKKLNLIDSYTEKEFDSDSKKPVVQDSLDINSFFVGDNIKMKILGVEYIVEDISNEGIYYTDYKEDIEGYKVKQDEKVSAFIEIIKSSTQYKNPDLTKMNFSVEDYNAYFTYLSGITERINKDKAWGGDFSSLLDLSSDYFQKPEEVMKKMNSSVLDTVISSRYIPGQAVGFPYYVPHLDIVLNNNKSDTLKITSQNSIVFCLPYTIEYKGKKFETYDTRITTFLRNCLPKDFNLYKELFAGELIYILIAQDTINKMEYKKCP